MKTSTMKEVMKIGALGAVLAVVATCQGGSLPAGLLATQEGKGPEVRFDLYAKPLPEVPLPSDLAARPDPDSPTGIRLNASHVAPTDLEGSIREQLDTLDGWGTYSPISLGFDCTGDRDDICLDLDNIIRRHQADGYDFADDAIYLVNISPTMPDPADDTKRVPNPDYGKPVPLDVGGGNFPLYLDRADYYYPNDPRNTSPTIIFESVNEIRGEDADGDGRLDRDEDADGDTVLDPGEDLDGDGWLDVDEDADDDGRLDVPDLDKPESPGYDPAFDTNFDGELGRANVWCSAERYRAGGCHCLQGHECPRGLDPNRAIDMERLSFLLDPKWHTAAYYEFATNTLIMRPLIPLRERSKYAVLLTDRLVGQDREPVRSPFPAINHTEQTKDLAALPDILAAGGGAFGGLALDDVRFAWTFTTQSVTKDLQELRRGLYGYGKFARLLRDFPNEAIPARSWACNPKNASCSDTEDFTPEQIKNHFIVQAEYLIRIIEENAQELFDISPKDAAPVIDAYKKYVDYFVIGHFWAPNFLDSDGDGVEEYRAYDEDVDGDGKLEYSEDANCNGRLDDGEDLDKDGQLDTGEDDNGNEILDPGEDKDGDGRLDGNEDRNRNCKLDTVKEDEGVWKVNWKTGEGKYGATLVPFFITVPKQEFKAKGKENDPFPVVFYGHGYTGFEIESLGFGGSLAQFGLATAAINCVHHGIGDTVIRTLIDSLMQVNNLTGLVHGLLADRTTDLNGDGSPESAGDFWTAYVFHTRDVVRQSALDHYKLIQIFRSFDGVRRVAPIDIDRDGTVDEKWDFVNWKGDPASKYYEKFGDYDNDGVLDLAGDFNGDGKVDVGGPDNWYFAWGQSLGGIMSALMGGAEPSIRAIAPTSGGGGLGDIAMRSTQGGVKEAVILRTIGPILDTRKVSADMVKKSQSVCREGDLSLEFTVPDLNDTANIELACACFGDGACPDKPEYRDHYTLDVQDDAAARPLRLKAGDGVTIFNVEKKTSHCALVGPSGEVRISYPSDLLDRIEVAFYDGSDGPPFVDFESCDPREEGLLTAYIRTWRRTQQFQFWQWRMSKRESDAIGTAPVGELLRSPAEGYGIVKNTPSFRRFLLIAQVALEPGDPINYAPHYFLEPLVYTEEQEAFGARPHASAMIIGTVGDMNVPVNTAAAQGRAAGIIDLFNRDTTWGRTTNQVLLDTGMIEAVEKLARTFPDDASGVCTPAEKPGGCPILFDVDDMDRGCDEHRSPYLEQPLREWVPSVPSDWGACVAAGTDGDTGFEKQRCGKCELLWSTSETAATPSRLDECRHGRFLERVTCPGGVSVQVWPYMDKTGQHGFDIPKPCNPFDIDQYMINMIGTYFASGGTTVSWEMCQQMQAREDARSPDGTHHLFCPTWKWWTCPACPNRTCDQTWYEAHRPAGCPSRWEDIPENEHELLPAYYTTSCDEEEE